METTDNRPTLAWVAGPDLHRWTPLFHLLKASYRIVAFGGGDARQVEKVQRSGFEAELHSLGRTLHARRDLAALAQLRRRWVELRPDVALCVDTKPGILGPWAGRLARVPVVVRLIPGLGTLHSYASPDILWRRRLMHGIFKISRNLADLTLFQSAKDRRRYLRLDIVEARRSRVIAALGSPVAAPEEQPNRDLLRLAVRRRLALPDDAEIVLMQSRLVASKGFDDLVHAVPLVRGLRPKCRVVVAGHRDRDALDALSDQQLTALQDQVLWLGSREDGDDLLGAADLFVYPSFYREGIPRALVRASLHGLPIVAADTESCRQVVSDGQTGLLVPRHRPQKLAKAITELLADRPLATSLAEESRRRTLQRHGIEEAADQLHRRLQSLLAAAASRRRRAWGTFPIDLSA